MQHLKSKGFTIIELLIYIAVLAVVLTLAMQFTLGVIDARARSNTKEEVETQAAGILQAFDSSARSAEGVYDSTSNFTSDPGQLSLITSESLPLNETTSYTDVYLDGGKFCIKREMSGVSCASSSRVELTNLTFRKITQSGGAESVQMRFTIRFRTSRSEYYATQTFQTSARLRAY